MDEFITEQELADWLKVSRRTVQEMRYSGEGPPFIAIGSRTIRYKKTDVIEWFVTSKQTLKAEKVDA